jgi:hypothetical protein
MIIVLDMNAFDEMICEVIKTKPKEQEASNKRESTFGGLKVITEGRESLTFENSSITGMELGHSANSNAKPPETVMLPKLDAELRGLEKMLRTTEKRNTVSGVLVFWKNYNAFKVRVNTPGSLDSFTTLYSDYTAYVDGKSSNPVYQQPLLHICI